MRYINGFLKGFYFYISIVGLLGFSLFIMEESCQQLTFGIFSSTDSGEWSQTRRNIDLISEIGDRMTAINKLFMMLQPVQWWAYESYIASTREYVESIRLEILANDPGVYVGELMDFQFHWDTATHTKEGWKLRNGRISYHTAELPKSRPVKVTGVLVLLSGNTYLLQEVSI